MRNKPAPPPLPDLLFRAQTALGLSQVLLADHLGVGRRTAQRWSAGQSKPKPDVLRRLATEVEPRDAELAELLARAAGDAHAPGPDPRLVAMIDAIVATAADELGLAPRLVRPALAASIARARALGVSLDQLARALGH